MKLKNLTVYLVAIFALCAGSVQAAPAVNPYAAGLASSAYSSNSYAGAAESVFNGDYWNAGSHGTFWFQADMGVSRTLSEIRLVLDVFPANYGTSYSIYLADTSIQEDFSALSSIATYSGYAERQSLNFTFAPQSGRFLEIVANGGASWTALGGGARTSWTETALQGGNVPSVPEPAIYSSMLAGLGVICAISRRRKETQST